MSTLRSLTVDARLYRWRVYHRHHPPSGCAEVVYACAAGFRQSGLRLFFPEGPGRFSDAGEVFDLGEPPWALPLHRPKAVAHLIRLARLHGWAPETSRREHVVEAGHDLVRRHLDTLADVMTPPPIRTEPSP